MNGITETPDAKKYSPGHGNTGGDTNGVRSPGLTVCSLFLLAGIGILLGHIQEPGISSVAEGYGAVLLRNGADLYVTIGIASLQPVW